MHLSTREDIEAPIDHVWASVTDFDSLEAQARGRGVAVTRSDPAGGPGLGSAWDVAFEFRGKPRKIRAKAVGFDAPETMRIDSHSGGAEAVTMVSLVPLSPRRTRLQVEMEVTAKSLSARLLVQSLKLARGAIEKRFANRIASVAESIEQRYRQAG